MKRGRTGAARLIDAARYSMRGIRACWASEAAFRLDVGLSVVLTLLACFVARGAEQWLLLTGPLLLLLIVELLNSAIEAAVDRIGRDHNEMSGRAKDMGSAAVFLCLVLIGLSWAVVLWHNYIA